MNDMKYWAINAQTPYFGEECWEAIAVETYNEAEKIAWDIMYNNAMDWYDDEVKEDYDWADYLGDCRVSIYEITHEEYLNYY